MHHRLKQNPVEIDSERLNVPRIDFDASRCGTSPSEIIASIQDTQVLGKVFFRFCCRGKAAEMLVLTLYLCMVP